MTTVGDFYDKCQPLFPSGSQPGNDSALPSIFTSQRMVTDRNRYDTAYCFLLLLVTTIFMDGIFCLNKYFSCRRRQLFNI